MKKLEKLMEPHMDEILSEFINNGIVYESQYQILYSMFCKKNAHALIKLFSKKTNLDIYYTYDQYTCNFVFYDANRFEQVKAIEKSISFQNKKFPVGGKIKRL